MLPSDLHMGHEARNQNQIDRPVADDLVGDVDLPALRVQRLRSSHPHTVPRRSESLNPEINHRLPPPLPGRRTGGAETHVALALTPHLSHTSAKCVGQHVSAGAGGAISCTSWRTTRGLCWESACVAQSGHGPIRCAVPRSKDAARACQGTRRAPSECARPRRLLYAPHTAHKASPNVWRLDVERGPPREGSARRVRAALVVPRPGAAAHGGCGWCGGVLHWWGFPCG